MNDPLNKALSRQPFTMTDNGDAEYPNDDSENVVGVSEVDQDELDIEGGETELPFDDDTAYEPIDDEAQFNDDDIESLDF